MSGNMIPEQLAFEEAAKASVSSHRSLNLGTFFLASGTDMLLCGVMIIQMLEYWAYSKDDRRFKKIIVLVTTISSIGATIFIVVLMFKLFVYNFGEYTPFAAIPDLTYMCIFDIIPSTATQLFFTHRAFKLAGRSKILVGLIGLMMLVAIAGAIGFPITQAMYHTNKSNSLLQAKIALTYLWLSGSLGADVLITSSIMWGLLKSKTGWKETDRTITRLIRVMVETQLPPTVLLIVFFVFVFGFPTYYLDIYPLWVQSKFYTCGLLASLNSRYLLRKAVGNGSSTGMTPSKPPVVHVLTETYIQQSEATLAKSHPQTNSSKPRYMNEHNNTHFSSHRKAAKDPLNLDLDLDLDDDSIELQALPQNGNNNNHNIEGEGDYESGHKMDYLDNNSKTGLTEGVASSGKTRSKQS